MLNKCSVSLIVFLLLSYSFAGNIFGFIPNPSHVVVLVLENHGYNSVVGSSAAPYINSLINDPYSALFNESYALSHPSQPNYIQLFSGSTQGVTNDNIPAGIPFTAPNLGAALLNASHTFTAFSEGLPSVGYTGAVSGSYASKHNPWVNWQGTGVNGIPAACNQPFSAFPTNFNLLPDVSFVIPNQDNDMHNGTDPLRINTCDTWVQTNLDAYIQWAKTNNSLLIVTFDEDDNVSIQHILTFIIGSGVQHGVYSVPIDHYSLLSLIEDMYNLPNSGSAASAAPIDYCWTTCSSLNVTISGNNPIQVCAGNTVTLLASGVSAYNWLPGNITGSSITVSPTVNTTYYVTGTDVNGCTKTTNKSISINAAIPSVPGTISGSTIVCANSINKTYSVSAAAGVTYNWTPPSGVTILSGQGTNSIICNFNSNWSAGNLSVTGSNACGISGARTLAIKSILAAPTAITGSVYQCASTTGTFGCTAVSGATSYLWSITGDATISGNGISSTVSFGPTFTTGVLSVMSVNLCGNSSARTITLKNTVAAPTAISGPTSGLCSSGTSSATYTATAVAGAVSYIWTLPSGATGSSSSNSISVTFGPLFTLGNISVAAVSPCGIASGAKILAVKSVLTAPTTITGSASGLCNVSGISYTCATVTGATSYTWTAPAGATIVSGQGTATLVVNFGSFSSGNITVKANNGCGSSPAKVLALKGSPAVPAAIIGVTGICAMQTGAVYSIAAVANASSYTWTVPTGAVIVSGQSTNSIVVNFGSTAGNITVKSNNACGSSAVKTLVTSITCLGLFNSNLKSIDSYEENQSSFFVYPNPVGKELTLSAYVESGKEISFEIYDINGKKIIGQKRNLIKGENLLTSTAEGLESGMYLLRITDNDKNVLYSEKIIKD